MYKIDVEVITVFVVSAVGHYGDKQYGIHFYRCLLHLLGYIDKNNLPIKTVHLTDILAGGWGNI